MCIKLKIYIHYVIVEYKKVIMKVDNRKIVRFFIDCKLERYIPIQNLTPLETEIINTILIESNNIEKQYNLKILIETLGNDIDFRRYYHILVEDILEKESLCWGRILITFTYAAYVVQKYLGEENNEMIEHVINNLTYLIDTKTASWIENVGGWKSFLPYVKKDAVNTKKKVLTIFAGCIGIFVLKKIFIDSFFKL